MTGSAGQTATRADAPSRFLVAMSIVGLPILIAVFLNAPPAASLWLLALLLAGAFTSAYRVVEWVEWLAGADRKRGTS